MPKALLYTLLVCLHRSLRIIILILYSDYKFDNDIIKRYRKALDTALRISCVHNINPIPGTSIIVCDVDEFLDNPCSSAKSFGKKKTVLFTSLVNQYRSGSFSVEQLSLYFLYIFSVIERCLSLFSVDSCFQSFFMLFQRS